MSDDLWICASIFSSSWAGISCRRSSLPSPNKPYSCHGSDGSSPWEERMIPSMSMLSSSHSLVACEAATSKTSLAKRRGSTVG
eukprot:1256294-Rhodomonas_salina.2